VPNVFRTAIQSTSHFYRNDLNNNNHWLKLRLVGTSSNRAGLGTKIRTRATINGQTFWQLREASSQNTFCGENSPEIHFGLGEAASIDSLRLEWPSGQVEAYANIQANVIYEVEEGAGLHPLTTAVKDHAPQLARDFALEQNYPNPFNPDTRMTFVLPVASRVTLTVFDVEGRVVAELIHNQRHAAGRNEVKFIAQNLAGGIYIYKLEAISANGALSQYVATQTMTYLK